MIGELTKDRVVDTAREVLALDRAELPACPDSALILATLSAVADLADEDLHAELVSAGFLAGATRRRQAMVEPLLRPAGGRAFQMGTQTGLQRHFYGETPRHTVELSAFALAETAVTNEMYGTMRSWAREVPESTRAHPVVNVSWFDAALFAAWVGARLPTEAEWEFACGAGQSGQWCCPADDLPRYAWYSHNAGKRLHPVATREPNSLGIYDMHGNVWEWCQDAYDQDFYARSPVRDPVNGSDVLASTGQHKVSRGGGFLALSEMCRTRYRLHDPAGYSAFDLGFRLACDSVGES